jgi:hypothetical protein
MSWENDDFVAEGAILAPLPPVHPPYMPYVVDHMTPALRQEFQNLRQQGYIETDPGKLTAGRRYVIFHAYRYNAIVRVERKDNQVYQQTNENGAYLFREDLGGGYEEGFYSNRDVFFEAPGQRGGKRKATKRRKTRKVRKSRKNKGRK